MKKFNFDIKKKDDHSKARSGLITTPNGDIETPAFSVVGTKGTVKAMTVEMVNSVGSQVVLANTYHLYLQPGKELVKKHGGLGKFMNWSGPTMTDSGGFQVFSLGEAFGTNVSKIAKGETKPIESKRGQGQKKMCVIDEQGVTFRSYIDGSEHRFTPEKSMDIQWDLGADIIFAFDECSSPVAPLSYQIEAMNRTHRWAKRCLEHHSLIDKNNVQALFAVVQGGRHQDLRKESAQILSNLKSENGREFEGFGIGGSFNKEDLATAVGWVTDELPEDKPRHLLGIGEPGDLVNGVLQGIDLFDCVAPTRNARNGTLYTLDGPINIENAKYRDNLNPLTKDCDCYTCKSYSISYLVHLLRAKEILASTLLSIHNTRFVVRLVAELRQAIINENLSEYAENFMKRYYKKSKS